MKHDDKNPVQQPIHNLNKQMEVQTFGSPTIDLLNESEQHYFYGMLLEKIMELCK